MVFIHEPDFGACFNHDGNIAKRVNGRARAMANPNIPTAGATMFPDVAKSTSRKRMIGPVHENDTRARVNAIRNMEISPLVLDAFASTLFAQLDGSDISNHPKKDSANTMSNRQNSMLKYAFVASELSEFAPNMAVMASPSPRYITTMDIP